MLFRSFVDMAVDSYSYPQFEVTRERLLAEVSALLRDEDRELLLSVKRGEPDWSLFPVVGLENLPAVQWKLANIEKLKKNARKHAEQLKALEKALSD